MHDFNESESAWNVIEPAITKVFAVGSLNPLGTWSLLEPTWPDRRLEFYHKLNIESTPRCIQHRNNQSFDRSFRISFSNGLLTKDSKYENVIDMKLKAALRWYWQIE